MDREPWHGNNAQPSLSHPPKRQKTSHDGLRNAVHELPNGSPTSRHEHYTVAWICALHIEMAAARAMLDELHAALPMHADDTNTYILGSIEQHGVVIACLPTTQYGTTNAANVVTNLKRSFPSIRLSLMVGIGGGVPSMADIRLGDIVVGTRVTQHDLGKTVEDGQIRRTANPKLLEPVLGTLVSTLRSKHELEHSRVMSILREKLERHSEYNRPSLPDRLFQATYNHESPTPTCDGCDESKLLPRNRRVSDDPMIHYGAIASGNQVMRDGTTRDNVARELDIICFEMEAAGLMDVLPCLPIRGICDYSDSHKNKEWQRYAAATAAAYARELLEALPTAGDRTHALRERPEARDCLHHLFLTDPSEDRKALKRKKGNRARDTCEWILGTEELTAWLGSDQIARPETQTSQVLWLYGNPGTGKSTMAIFLTEGLPKAFSTTDGKTLAYFFCDSSFDERKTAMSVVRGLLLQLMQQHPQLLDYVLPKYYERGAGLFNSFDALWVIFMAAAADQDTGRKYCIIDALDECDRESQETLLRQLQQTFGCHHSSEHTSNIRILIFSRPYPEIGEYLEEFANKDLASFPEAKNDIDRCIEERVADLAKRKRYTYKIRIQVSDILRDKAEGTFLWVGLACGELEKVFSKDAIEALRSIPKGLHSLYKRLLNTALIQHGTGDAIRRIISFVAVSQRPLSVLELSEACQLHQEEDDVETLAQFTRDQVASCRLLIIIQDEKVLLLHQSVRDFIVGPDGGHLINILEAHADFAYRCVDLLIEQFRNSIQSYAGFSSYATRDWANHARMAQQKFEIRDSQAEFFEFNSRCREHWLERLRLQRDSLDFLDFDERIPQQFSILHIAARWGVPALVNFVFRPENVNGKSSRMVDIDLVNTSGVTPLEQAAKSGHPSVVSVLLSLGATVTARVLHTAAGNRRNGKEAMALLLDRRGDEITITEEVLKAAAGNRLNGKEVMILLLDRWGDQITITEEVVKAAAGN